MLEAKEAEVELLGKQLQEKEDALQAQQTEFDSAREALTAALDENRHDEEQRTASLSLHCPCLFINLLTCAIRLSLNHTGRAAVDTGGRA